MIANAKLKITMLTSVVCLGFAGSVQGMEEQIAQDKKDQKVQRDASESFLILDQNLEVIVGYGMSTREFKLEFYGLDDKQRLAQNDKVDELKKAFQEANETDKPLKLAFPGLFYESRVKIFPCKGKNKMHYMVKYSRFECKELAPAKSDLKK